MDDLTILSVAKKYTDESVEGAGPIKGKNCQVQSVTDITGGHRVTFAWYNGSDVLQTTTMDVMDGEKGKDGKNGKDGKDAPGWQYSTVEQEVGLWIDGKTVYQITIEDTAPETGADGTSAEKFIALETSIDSVTSIKVVRKSGGYAWGEIPITNPVSLTKETISGKSVVANAYNFMMMAFVFDNNASSHANSIRLTNNSVSWNNIPVYITIQYTKTTDI